MWSRATHIALAALSLLPCADRVADWGIIALRWALFVSLGLLFGLTAFKRLSLGGDHPSDADVRHSWVILILAVLAAALSVIGFAMQVSSMTGMPLAEVDRATVQSLLDETALGLALKVRLAALVAAIILALAASLWRLSSSTAQALVSGVALATLAWSGHGAATDGTVGWVHLAADILHLIAASIWIGALAGFLWMLFRPGSGEVGKARQTCRVLADFATLGSTLVMVLLLTGLANAYFILRDGDPWAALAAPYGQFLALKIILFVGMLALAAVNRFRLTPSLIAAVERRDPERTLKPLRRSIVLEFGLGIGILILVAWLGTLAPNPMPGAS